MGNKRGRHRIQIRLRFRVNRDPSATEPHNYPIFIKSNCTRFDADYGKTKTDMLAADTDGDGLWDG